MSQKQIKILKKERAFKGFFEFNKYNFQFEKYDGTLSPPIEREIFERGHAVAALLYDPQKDVVVLIEQMRFPAYLASQDAWMTEIVAGMIDEGETPEQAICREIEEESQCHVQQLEFILDYMPSSGACTETVKLYLATVDSTTLSPYMGQADEHEDIFVFTMGAEEFIQKTFSNKFNNSVIIIAGLWFQANHQRLKAQSSM